MSKNYIPTINVSSLISNNFNTESAKKTLLKIKKASIEVGFFQIISHGISKKNIKDITSVGNNFFKSSNLNKMKLAPKKWNKKNKNIYRGYFPNDVNGKEGLDIGDLKVTKSYAAKLKNQYIEYLDLKKSLNKKSIKVLENYYDNIFNLSETLFKSIIKIYNLDIVKSKIAFRRQKTLRMTHYGIGLGNNIASNNHNIYRYQSVNPAIFQDDAVFLPPSSTPTAGTNNNNNTSYDSDLDLENTNAFLLFLQTLMPWNQVNPTTGTMLGGFMPQQLGEGGPIGMNNAEQIAIQQNILEQWLKTY